MTAASERLIAGLSETLTITKLMGRITEMEGLLAMKTIRATAAEARIAALEAELAARDAAYQSLLMTDAYLIGVLGKAALAEEPAP